MPTAPAGARERPVVYAAILDKLAVYDANTGALLETIGGFFGTILSLTVAPDGDIYVGVNAAPHDLAKTQVYAFHAGANRPFAIIDEKPSYNVEVAVAATGELAVVREAASHFKYSIDFYAPGARRPTRTLVPKWDAIFDIIYAPDGRLWVAGLDPSVASAFGFIAPGAMTIAEVPFALQPPLFGPMLIDPVGDIVVPDIGHLIANTPQGNLAYVVPLQTRPRYISGIVLSPNGRRVYVADPNSQIEVYDYPSGGAMKMVFGPGTSVKAIAVGTIPR